MDGLVLSLALIVASAAAPAASLKFHCDGAESANAVYHLACLTGHIPCTQDVFERFSHDTLQWTAADQRELDAWTTGQLPLLLSGARCPAPHPACRLRVEVCFRLPASYPTVAERERSRASPRDEPRCTR